MDNTHGLHVQGTSTSYILYYNSGRIPVSSTVVQLYRVCRTPDAKAQYRMIQCIGTMGFASCDKCVIVVTTLARFCFYDLLDVFRPRWRRRAIKQLQNNVVILCFVHPSSMRFHVSTFSASPMTHGMCNSATSKEFHLFQ